MQGGFRYIPFWTGEDDEENQDYLEQMETSMSLSEHHKTGETMLPNGWTVNMKKAALKTTKERLSAVRNHLRTQYRRKYLNCGYFLDNVVPLLTNLPSYITVIYGSGSTIEDPPTLNEMLELSRNPEAYAFYFEHFLRYVVQPKLFENGLQQYPKLLSSRVDKFAKSISGARGEFDEFVTIAEETLGLFIMANYQGVWDAQIEQNKMEVEVTPKYTRAKNRVVLKQKEDGVSVTNGEKLSSDGTTYYNELSLKVQHDRRRRARKKWEEKLLQDMSNKQAGKGKRKVREVTPPVPTHSTVRLIPNWKRNKADAGDESDGDNTIDSN
jgi:hypothetical protein